ncbi:glycosyl hydrolase [Microbacterium sp. AGC85]
MTDDRPGMRWWWQSPVPAEELVRELRAIADAGFGEVEVAFSPGFWADGAQRYALGVVLDEAKRLGIGVATTLGAAWPLQTPNTSKGTPDASKELQYGVTYLKEAAGRVTVPSPFDDPDRQRGGQPIAVTLARVVRRGPGPITRLKQDPWRGEVQEIVGPDEATLLDSASLETVTDDVTDGSFSWDGRTGEWAVFAFWLRDTEQGVTSFLDRAAAIAATEYIDVHQIGPDNAALLPLAGTDLFEDSLELNADSLFWSPDLLERFQKRHGYDLTPLLPVLFAHGMCRYWVPNDEPIPDFELDTGGGPQVRHDYNELLTDLYIQDHLLVLQDWATSHGMRHKAQVAYGQNLEPVRSNREFVRRGGRAEGESLNSGDRAPVAREHPNWRFALDWQRSIVGGAHQGGGVRVSTELGAQFAAAYMLTLGDLQQMLDKEWAAGITKPFVHGFASQAPGTSWPTQSRFFDYVADSWNDTHFPEWNNWRPLTDYWARGTAVLETGLPRTDVAVYRDGFLTTAARGSDEDDFTAPSRLVDGDPLERAGYTVQFLDPVGLVEGAAHPEKTVLFPDGPAYRAVVVNEEAITPEAAEALDEAAGNGLAVLVVGEPPTRASGFGHQDGDERVKRAFTRLIGRRTARCINGFEEAVDALADLGVFPRVMTNGHAILTQWRDAQTSQYVLVYNTERTSVESRLSIEGMGSLYELDLWSGHRHQASASYRGGRTETDIVLAPLGLRILELVEDQASVPPAAQQHPGILAASSELALEDWTLEVRAEEPDGPRDIQVEGQGPGDWRDIPELASVSGIGVYRTRVRDAAEGRIAVSLGDLAGSATVRINGEVKGVVFVPHGTVEIGESVRQGDVLEIEVRTPLRNAVVAVGTRAGVGSATRAQGLIGPVRVLLER